MLVACKLTQQVRVKLYLYQYNTHVRIIKRSMDVVMVSACQVASPGKSKPLFQTAMFTAFAGAASEPGGLYSYDEGD